jgi:hypothetical protein
MSVKRLARSFFALALLATIACGKVTTPDDGGRGGGGGGGIAGGDSGAGGADGGARCGAVTCNPGDVCSVCNICCPRGALCICPGVDALGQ